MGPVYKGQRQQVGGKRYSLLLVVMMLLLLLLVMDVVVVVIPQKIQILKIEGGTVIRHADVV